MTKKLVTKLVTKFISNSFAGFIKESCEYLSENFVIDRTALPLSKGQGFNFMCHFRISRYGLQDASMCECIS